MKYLFRTAKVIYDGSENQYEVYYRNWFFWQFDSVYKVDTYLPDWTAKEHAILRAEALLKTVEVWRQSNINYY